MTRQPQILKTSRNLAKEIEPELCQRISNRHEGNCHTPAEARQEIRCFRSSTEMRHVVPTEFLVSGSGGGILNNAAQVKVVTNNSTPTLLHASRTVTQGSFISAKQPLYGVCNQETVPTVFFPTCTTFGAVL